MSWLTDTNAVGKTMQDVDGTRGVVLEVDGDKAYIDWQDGTKSWREEGYLTYVEDEQLSPSAQKVLAECLAEAWRNAENSDVHSEADVAADIMQRLHRIYGVWAYSEGPDDTPKHAES